MLGNIAVNTFNSVQIVGQSFGATPGVSVTPGASSVEGSWTAWATTSTDVYGVYVRVAAGTVTGQVRMHMLDIGIDPAGGTSYTAVISDIACGDATGVGQGGRPFYFPYFIPSGSSIAVRIQGSNATAGTVRVYGMLFGKPSRPELVWAGEYAETIGVTTGTKGTALTPGTSGYGSWVSLGTSTRNLKYWQVAMQWDTLAATGQRYGVDLAYGDGTNFRPILEHVHYVGVISVTPIGLCSALHPEPHCYCDVPAGSTIYARVWCSGTPSPAGATWNVTAIGIGG